MADRICENCMSRVPLGSEKCPKCGIVFENTNPGGALPNGWVLGERYTIGRYIDIDGEGVTYSAIDGNTLQRVIVKEYMPVTLCATRTEDGSIQPKPGCEVLFKTTRMDFSDLYAELLRLGLVEGLVQVLDVVEANNTAYAVLEKIEGPTLTEYLTKKEGPMDPTRAVALMRPVLNGVETMHNANLIHRGISPDNIILESGGTAKLCGYATLALRQQGSELKPKLYPGYSAPEQYAASEFEGRYTDVYALGAVLYRLVAGRTPYAADERKLQDNQRPARMLSKEVPAFLSTAMVRAMRIPPVERIQDISDFRLALAGEGSRDTRNPLGLTRQQVIIGVIAVAAVVVVLIIILLVSAFMGGDDGKKPESQDSSIASSLPPSSSVASQAQGSVMIDLVGRKYDEVAKNAAYTDVYTFAEPVEVYSAEVEAGRIISHIPKAGDTWDGVSPIQLTVSKGAEPVEMPDFVNVLISQGDAKTVLNELNIDYEVVEMSNNGEYEPGMVVKTEPEPKTLVTPKKDKVILYVAADVALIAMPNVVGQTEANAVAELKRLGITDYRTTTAENDGTHAEGTVAETVPSAGLDVATGATIVELRIYDTFYMPDLSEYIGESPDKLYTYLQKRNVGYSIREVDNSDPNLDGCIQSLDYVINGAVTKNTVVTIYLYKDAPDVVSVPDDDWDEDEG